METGKEVIAPHHKGMQLALGTLNSISDGSGIPRDALRA